MHALRLLAPLLMLPVALPAQPLALDEIFLVPDYSLVQISPDGRSLGIKRKVDIDGENRYTFQLMVYDLETNEAIRSGGVDTRVFKANALEDFMWLPDNTLLTFAEGLIFQTNRDFSDGHAVALGGYSTAASYPWLLGNRIDAVVLLAGGGGKRTPSVKEMNLTSGNELTQAPNPMDNGLYFIIDAEGTARFFQAFDENNTFHSFYRSKQRPDWQKIEIPEDYVVITGDTQRDILYVTAYNGRDYSAVYEYDPLSQTLGKELYSEEGLDVSGLGGWRTIQRELRQGMLGVDVQDRAKRRHWFEPAFNEAQDALVQVYPETRAYVVGADTKRERILLLRYGDRQPPQYFLYDRPSQKLRKLFDMYPTIDTSRLKQTYMIRYPNENGDTIPALLTLPDTPDKKPFPMIVIPPDGLMDRHDWEFSQEAQYWASRGFAVLQPNTRGSWRLGKKLFFDHRYDMDARHKDLGAAVQWAIDKGFADPQRIAAFASDWGALSVLNDAIRHPGRYQAIVAATPVADLDRTIRVLKIYNDSPYVAQQLLAGLEVDETAERELSPLRRAEEISCPIFVTYYEWHDDLFKGQAKRLYDTVKKNQPGSDIYMYRSEFFRAGFDSSNWETFREQAEAFILRETAP